MGNLLNLISKKQNLASYDALEQHEILFKSYFKPLVVYATRMVGDRSDAEDIVQEVFANIWKKRESFKFEKGVQSYLFGATKNGCLNHYRHLKVVQKCQNQSKYQSEVNDNPLHYMMLNEIEKKIEDTLDSLPSKTKSVFVMSRYEQKKNKEIADVMNISIKTVEAHMSSVLSALRRNLKHYISHLIIVIINI